MHNSYELFFEIKGIDSLTVHKICENILYNYNVGFSLFDSVMVNRLNDEVEISDGLKLEIFDLDEEKVKIIADTIKNAFSLGEIIVRKKIITDFIL